MITRTVMVSNPDGLHLRPAGKIASLASSYQSQIELERSGQIADCRSMIGLLTLGAAQGTELILRVQGPDADDAIEAITKLFDTQFDEP